eukprot:TRINITY_DN12860_c0_g2_i3.p1 TRINITY_DN12860_c0_g2~~TRINITY_DN12860_c0_g2_i3.p1  ORF type:complete len:136 (+),score=17.17 TRINITY_DN12860_c0_g2_i3:237-644(+)
MVTSRPYHTVLDKEIKDETVRLRGTDDDDERKRISQYVLQYHKEITNILHRMNRDLLLLFKTNEFLKMLDNKLGNPVNTFRITADYCMLTVSENYKNRQSLGIFEQMKLKWTRYRIKFKMILLALYLNIFRSSFN